MTWRRLIFIAIVAFGAYQYWQSHSNAQYHIGPITDNVTQLNGYQIELLEPITLEARVLSSKHYTLGREADLSPVDLALGWGPMADEAVTKKLNISQSNRWYRWQTKTLPIPKRDIETHSANMHMIPATPVIAKAIKAATSGDMIQFTGDLVLVTGQGGRWRWKSSLTREDTGAGACELVLVKSFQVMSGG